MRELEGREERNERTNEAPEESVVPQSPSPTRVSYCVIVGSEEMSLLQPVVIMAFMIEGEGKGIAVEYEDVGCVDEEEVVCDRGVVGFGSGER